MDDYSKNTNLYAVAANCVLMDPHHSTSGVVVRLFIFVFILFIFTAILLTTAVSWRTANLNGKSNNNTLNTLSDGVGSSEVSFFLEPVEFKSTDDFGRGELISFDVFDERYGLEKGVNKETEAEALAALHAAAQCKAEGKIDKASRLYEHALSLQPTHPEVLIEYGLFMERVTRDVVAAETMFTRALIYDPNHDLARRHQSRTQPLVAEIDGQMLANLDRKRDVFLRIPRGSSPMKRVMREAYFEHVYHTVALEGNTMTLAQTRSILETHLAVGGKSVIEHNEILGMDAALRYLNQSLVHRIGSITVDDILRIHHRVLGFVDPFEAGRLRRTQVYVGGFVPTPPDQLEKEMDEFVDWLNSESALRIHPVELAALAHYKFVVIHPFVDGNGRTGRLLMNLILMQAGFPPVVVKVEDRLRYYETLKLANEGDLRHFIRLIAACTDKTLDHYLRFTTEISPPSASPVISDAAEIEDKIIPPILVR